MLIRCWGSRGSIPVDGAQYIKYGGNTTCMEVRAGDNVIIVDAGSGIRALGNKLLSNGDKEYHLFFTHVHWDHIQGFPFFKPLFQNKTKLTIHGSSFCDKPFSEVIAKTMEAPYFPITINGLSTKILYNDPSGKEINLEALSISSIPLSHPNNGFGYKFVENGKKFVFLTDNELTFEHPGCAGYNEYVDFSKNADLLIHDSEYLPDEYDSRRGWGHTTYIDALDFAIKANVKRFGLFHLNQERSDEEVDAMLQECKDIVASRNIKMECFAIGTGFEITL